MFIWDENKRVANLKKHGLDFEDAHWVFNSSAKKTYPVMRREESRFLDIALAEFAGEVLALIYVPRGRDIRVISFRAASRRERKAYERDRLGKS